MLFEFGYKSKQFLRNRYGTAREITKWADAIGKDVYRSVFGYPDHDLKHEGLLWGTPYFDLDCENDLKKPYDDLKALINIFEIQGIKANDLAIFFSGYKGFHVNFYDSACQLPDSCEKPFVFKEIASQLSPYLPNNTVDLAVYESRRLWRIPNTINSKSGLYKILLPFPLPTIEEIQNLAKTPQPLDLVPPPPNLVIKGLYDRAEKELVAKLQPKHTQPVYPSKQIAPQVLEQITAGKPQGERDAGCFYLIKYLMAKGFSQGEAEPLLIQYGQSCTPPFPEAEIYYKLERQYGNISN